ncbi:hypothetical protein EMIHUDRAFT_212925 [Emiliania huxleyi CCMP1516]|uniref:PH domain-containing protein n=2 Tax=Emiliania huxleyi TaxID=2903 RepID=A0A0D3IPI2_EMIH1|nr:hypothetical protein EMIHUDRAFT_212925 [Emiliania huxleyi CCMP1516]EOD13167.1 hypothetical protein EMIHUDRAFT_212925 [Emiliania huxleyi CCMP1516]|eukprot:XP_005765596.1 hypothetical protein EMIHUDRAFT_212925 [Emiliania huxleyi CCMP1516]
MAGEAAVRRAPPLAPALGLAAALASVHAPCASLRATLDGEIAVELLLWPSGSDGDPLLFSLTDCQASVTLPLRAASADEAHEWASALACAARLASEEASPYLPFEAGGGRASTRSSSLHTPHSAGSPCRRQGAAAFEAALEAVFTSDSPDSSRRLRHVYVQPPEADVSQVADGDPVQEIAAGCGTMQEVVSSPEQDGAHLLRDGWALGTGFRLSKVPWSLREGYRKVLAIGLEVFKASVDRRIADVVPPSAALAAACVAESL